MSLLLSYGHRASPKIQEVANLLTQFTQLFIYFPVELPALLQHPPDLPCLHDRFIQLSKVLHHFLIALFQFLEDFRVTIYN